MKAAVIHLGPQSAQCKQPPLRVREMSRIYMGETFERNPRVNVTHPTSCHVRPIANIILLLVGTPIQRAQTPDGRHERTWSGRLAPIAVEDGKMADPLDPVAVVAAGSDILGHVLSPAGFTFQLANTGHSSGGAFAAGRFSKGSQYLEFHFRHSLGKVIYGWGDATLSHADYLRGLDATGAYPGYSADPLDGFRHLARDLAGPLSG